MKDVTVAAWQAAPTPGDVEGNLKRVRRAAQTAAGRDADIVVVPEMFLTGWHPEATRLAVSLDGDLVGRVGDLTRDAGLWLASSLLTRRDGRYYNTFTLWDDAGRVAGTQDKIHLWADEARTVTPGVDVAPIETPWGAVGGVVCYDVEFPEVCRRLALDGCEFFLVPSAFYSPTGWDLSTRTRALENGCFLAAANQVGGRPENPHNGMSRLVDPYGELIESLGREDEGLLVARFEAETVGAARAYAPFLRDLRFGRRTIDA